ncbi:MAG: energy transducer TonB [Bryobacteraceae bacterium]|jgi:hypothetical protein
MMTNNRILMRLFFVCCAGVLIGMPLVGSSHKADAPLPDRLVIGRDSFWDFGPPFHYYEVISVIPARTGSRIDRILVTPPGDVCTQPAKVEETTVTVSESVAGLLQGANPCSIPEKELRRERKRCKHCLTFSGVNVTMQAQCGEEQREVRIDILDRDIYGTGVTKTPQHTSWTMGFLQHLDQALGPGVPDKPMFDLSESASGLPPENGALNDLAAGKFDALFGGPEKVSEFYRQAQHPPPEPTVELIGSEPFKPVSYEVPKYPHFARIAHISGRVTFTARITSTGNLTDVKFVEGHPLLRPSAQSAAAGWLYAKESTGTEVHATLNFRLNCESDKK